MYRFFFISLIFYSHFSFALSVVIPADKDIIKHYNEHKEVKKLSQQFKILVWNIYKGKKEAFSHDFQKMSRKSDLILIQEAVDSKKVIKNFSALGEYEFVFASSWIDGDKKIATGVSTGSSATALDIQWYQSVNREPILKTPKLSLATSYEFANSDKKLLLVNVHALNFVGSEKFSYMLRQTITLTKNHVGPLIIAGDFNTWSKKKLASMEAELTGIGMNSVSFINDRRTRFLGKPLDHIWIRGLKVKSSKVYGKVNSSDHKPMSCELELII